VHGLPRSGTGDIAHAGGAVHVDLACSRSASVETAAPAARKLAIQNFPRLRRPVRAQIGGGGFRVTSSKVILDIPQVNARPAACQTCGIPDSDRAFGNRRLGILLGPPRKVRCSPRMLISQLNKPTAVMFRQDFFSPGRPALHVASGRHIGPVAWMLLKRILRRPLWAVIPWSFLQPR